MQEILIITGSHDIQPAEIVASSLSDYKVYFFDPTLVDVIRESTLLNTEFVEWKGCPDWPALDESAHQQAFAFENAVDLSLRSILPGIRIDGWQHLNLYYFYVAFLWYSKMWSDMHGILKAGHVHVFVNDNPASFYWPSFFPALLLLEQLRTWGQSFSALTYGARPDESDVVINMCVGNSEGLKFDLLTHLPTCFYDVEYINEELRASGRMRINITPKYWSVDIDADTNINLIRFKDQQIINSSQPDVGICYEKILEKIESILVPFIATSSFRMRQAQHLGGLYRSQLVSLSLLENYFSIQCPSKILMSDHDAGFHGPLICYAERHRIPVLIMAHSKVVQRIPYRYKNIKVLTHPIQGNSPINHQSIPLEHATLQYPEIFSDGTKFPAPIKSIGILLNGIALNGVVCVNYAAYINGIKEIDRWCKTNKIEISIRCRQGQSLREILGNETEVSNERITSAMQMTLQEFAKGVDICLMYGAPTTAEMEFLRMGVPLLNPITAALGPDEAHTASSDVIPRGGIEEILKMLDEFIVSSTLLNKFKRHQFSKYVSLFERTLSLRYLL